ncbi:hypothetical protein [Photorhabdus antumapuensis]|uniref:hypothetical protein n=1 Tax=Photorhabdus antumapuensis TaxID=2862867 RepID=UPI001CEC1C50|nr:hypothetical protein [Photorhabdus antumapuensis]MCA6223143.1 hypothetical protein [Photorhabdus antumapuensis]
MASPVFEPAIGGGGMGTARALLSTTTHSIAKLATKHRFSLCTQPVTTCFSLYGLTLDQQRPDATFQLDKSLCLRYSKQSL